MSGATLSAGCGDALAGETGESGAGAWGCVGGRTCVASWAGKPRGSVGPRGERERGVRLGREAADWASAGFWVGFPGNVGLGLG